MEELIRKFKGNPASIFAPIIGLFIVVLFFYTVISDITTDPHPSEKVNNEYSLSILCEALISAEFGRDISAMKSSREKNYVHLYYFRPNDNSRWEYDCKANGNELVWRAAGSDTRWRNNYAYDTYVTYTKLSPSGLRINRKFSDGSSSTNYYTHKQLTGKHDPKDMSQGSLEHIYESLIRIYEGKYLPLDNEALTKLFIEKNIITKVSDYKFPGSLKNINFSPKFVKAVRAQMKVAPSVSDKGIKNFLLSSSFIYCAKAINKDSEIASCKAESLQPLSVRMKFYDQSKKLKGQIEIDLPTFYYELADINSAIAFDNAKRQLIKFKFF